MYESRITIGLSPVSIGMIKRGLKHAMEQIAVLVDYDNQRQGRYRGGRGTGRPPNYRDHADFIDDLINGILQHRKTFDDSLLEMRVRLYGGGQPILMEVGLL